MAGRNYPLRFIIPIALTSLLLLVLCASIAVAIYLIQTRTAKALVEDIDSRRAASDLEEDLNILLQQRPEAVGAVHERIANHLTTIQDFADKPDEKLLAGQLAGAVGRYLSLWNPGNVESVRRARAVVEKEMLPLAQKLRNYNAKQIEESEKVHLHTLAWLAWGLAGVGVLGSLAGLILGYGVARGLRRSIHRLQVCVRDAADKLGQDLPTVVLPEDGDLEGLNQQIRRLTTQIEQVVLTLQQREREVLRAEQLAAVGRLAAGVAHEIRNPLTSIKMLVQTGREEAAARGLPAEDLHVIELEIRRMERSLQTFLDFARPPKLKRTSLDLAPLTEHVGSLIRGRAAKQGVEIRLDRPGHPVAVEADGDQLRQVLVNLTLNALDAMPHGGTLDVRLRGPEHGWVELSVHDSGPGIAPAIQPRLFEPFVSDKETGLGLGLSVSRRIVEDHGGSLRASNPSGGGACFVVRLPVGAPSPGGGRRAEDAREEGGRRAEAGGRTAPA
jgi:signal transduction histidine kinase